MEKEVADIKKYIVVILFCFLLTGCKKYDNKREPISVEKIDWQYFTIEGEGDPASFQRIVITSEGNSFRIDRGYFNEFCKLMMDNPNKINTKFEQNTLKIYFRFNEDNPLLTRLYYKVNKKYNGKESIFYVDNSLLPELEKIKVRHVQTDK
ncbi:hypothetical protein [Bacillus sp. EAC]|uniref:hypothetical protein n=1 Tax=Bacillus sp. EAC TaxID=1978338 RepID=UPI000B45137B|nr:hypothetical protein [Bacillus sp. EAC]